MKTLSLTASAVLAAFFLLASTAPAHAQETVYQDGSVWDISYIRTEPGQFDNYMANLNQVWKQVLDQAIEEGHILSYRVFSSQPVNRDDWNLMLLVEYPNMAALDNLQEKYAPIRNAVLGSLQQANQATTERRALREILGGKLARELTFIE